MEGVKKYDQYYKSIDFDWYIEDRWNGRQAVQNPKGEIPYNPVAAMGLAGECGEVMELLKKHWRDGKHPGEDILLECGDVLHYLTVILQSYGYSLEEAKKANINKLVERDAKLKYKGHP